MSDKLTDKEFKARKKWRVDVMRDTQDRINETNYSDFLRISAENLTALNRSTRIAREELKHGRLTVSVIQRDCLEAAADIIKTFGSLR